jgi:hypothetical protein
MPSVMSWLMLYSIERNVHLSFISVDVQFFQKLDRGFVWLNGASHLYGQNNFPFVF